MTDSHPVSQPRCRSKNAPCTSASRSKNALNILATQPNPRKSGWTQSMSICESAPAMTTCEWQRMPPPVSCSVLTADPASHQLWETYTGCRSSTASPSKSQLWCIKFFIVAVQRLADLVAFSSTDSHRQLCSTTTRAAAIQRTRTQFGRRAFSVCGPDVWNSLPLSVRTVDSNSSFHLLLKLIFSSLRLTINCFYFLFLFFLFYHLFDYVMHGRPDFI